MSRPIEIKTPQFAESIDKAIVLTWRNKAGDFVEEGDILVELETDKVVLEVTAPVSGVIEKIIALESTEVEAQQVIALMTEGGEGVKVDQTSEKTQSTEQQKPKIDSEDASETTSEINDESAAGVVTPSARKQAVKQNIKADELSGSGKKGRVIKDDVLAANSTSSSDSTENPQEETKTDLTPKSTESKSETAQAQSPSPLGERNERAVPISRLRARVAERLLQSQHQTATLTTFNEVNMKAVMDLRKNYQEQFVEKYGIKLGFMSFFTIASVHALQRFPSVNAYLENGQIIYHDYCDIGIAMSTERGLMVPILRNTEKMNFADVEKAIVGFAQKAKSNKIEISDLQGGTFSITNGGIFGSLLSTPILNPPQSAILGLHAINPTPIVENNEVAIRPVMKLALSYDHRIIDGREAVSFLVVIKQMIENPVRMLFWNLRIKEFKN